MIYVLLADATLVLHLFFILFVLLGGLLTLHSRRWALLHLPAVFWGAFIEFSGRVCPLTPLENWFRSRGGLARYSTDFIQHYLLPVIYPRGLTREAQLGLGTVVLAVNLLVYICVFRDGGKGRRGGK